MRLRPSLPGLVVAQIAISLLLLVAAGPVRAHAVESAVDPARVQSRQRVAVRVECAAGRVPGGTVAAFYAELRRASREIPGVRAATLSHASLIRAGRAHPVIVDGVAARRHAASCKPGRGSSRRCRFRCCRAGRSTSAIAGDAAGRGGERLFARTYLRDRTRSAGASRSAAAVGPLDLEIVGVAATARYGGLKRENPAGRVPARTRRCPSRSCSR